MLRSLLVKNFAIIEDLRIDPSPGLNVLTGETGAGKSILVEALGFLLGARGSSSWLRSGGERLEVTGFFDRQDFPRELQAQFKIAGGPVMVRRELDSSGKTRAIINSQSAPLSALAALGEGLVDFHGQNEHVALLKPSVQLELLDRFAGHEDLLGETAAAYEAWSGLVASREAAQMSEEERRRRVELARLQLQEIDEAKLKEGEEEELEASLPLLKNAERLKAFSHGAYELLYEQEGSVLGCLLRAERALAELARIDPGMKASHDQLETARLSLEEVAHALGDYRDKTQASPGRLDWVLGRLDLILRLKKKYGPSVKEILAARERRACELSRLENAQERLGQLELELAAAVDKLGRACGLLHRERMKAARRLAGLVLEELKSLGLEGSRLEVSVELEEGRFARHGADGVEFLFSANPGEPLRPLKAVASGGELSRVMLALKTVLAGADRIPILVFDEVDAGIGGAVARAVGRRLSALGETHQVLCVTHLPQVACFAESHFHVLKEASAAQTTVRAERLEGERRLEAVALMLGGRQATSASRRHAQELLAASRAPGPLR